MVIQDGTEYDTPDSIFPNNWISFQQSGKMNSQISARSGSICLYPMEHFNRRKERQLLSKIKQALNKSYFIYSSKIKDYSFYETRGIYLEGTGSMIIDHVNRIIY
eukprot:UN25278